MIYLPFQGAPQVTENYLDSKKDVDKELKKTCEMYINHVSQLLVRELMHFVNKVKYAFMK